MSHRHSAEHGSAPTSTVFSPAEVKTFHDDDRAAATAVVCLLVGIFSLGLIGYLGVCWWVS